MFSDEMFPHSPPLDERSKDLRRLVIDALDGGGRGHLGSSMSLIEILRVIYDDVARHRPDDPAWDGRDRCILSKGHGCLAQYAALAAHGYFSRQEMRTFCHFPSMLGGHPERAKVPGVEASTGALGHGLSIGVGIALAARIKKADTRVFVVMGDGEINEGSVWEAAMSATKHGLENLTAVVDYNKLQSYGRTAEVLNMEPLADKWRAFGFETVECDGHDVEALRKHLSTPLGNAKPTMVIAHTVKGKGVAFAENEPTWHHKSRVPADQIEAMYAALAKES
ncbi:transketolase [Thalassospiraceae bacterium LMO-JJ14]|nr:transketolase [Thalassospiraceae bacterium LMO-JJ14]